MTTIVNSPAPAADNGGINMFIGVILLIGVVSLVLYFGIPAIRRMGPTQLTVPAPQIVMPEKIDVNVTQTK